MRLPADFDNLVRIDAFANFLNCGSFVALGGSSKKKFLSRRPASTTFVGHGATSRTTGFGDRNGAIQAKKPGLAVR